MKKRVKQWFIVTVGLSGLVLILMAGWVNLALHRPQHHAEVSQIVSISPGKSASEIYADLRGRAILSPSFIVRIWFRLKATTTTFKAGDYEFESPITPIAVLERLIEGEILTQRVVFPEGLTRFDLAERIQELDIAMSDQALRLSEDPGLSSLMQDLDPDATTLEGYLFPDTYQYTATTSAKDLMTKMVKRFRQVFTPEWQARAEELGLSVRQVVTLASMIEREARLAAERPLVSAVFHNRLRRNMKLDCDPTVIYASILAGKWSGVIRRSDLDRESPYNTYRTAGLPPGPIASPGKAAIEAALYPSQTNHLFFVVDATRDDGAHLFSATSTQHAENVAQYRLIQKQRANLKRTTEQ